VPFMRAYSLYVIQSCHRRNIHAMGGMAAQIPIKNDEKANEIALGRVKVDKLREVTDGHDGTWVAHPGLVPIAMEVFNANMTTPNQIFRKREDVKTNAADLLRIPEGTITEEGMRMNINVGILYIESWLRGNGAAAIHHLMEDAATAEISRTQLWQWIKNKAQLEDGRTITYDLYREMLVTEIENIRNYVGEKNYTNGQFPKAIDLFNDLVKDKDFIEFLTVPAYQLI
jgi:malate synthase